MSRARGFFGTRVLPDHQKIANPTQCRRPGKIFAGAGPCWRGSGGGSICREPGAINFAYGVGECKIYSESLPVETVEILVFST